MLLVLILCTVAILLVTYLLSRRKLYELASSFPGPKTLPLLGNLHHFLFLNSVDTFKIIVLFHKEFGNIFRVWRGSQLDIYCSDPAVVEVIWERMTVSERRPLFNTFLSPIIGDGLITTNDNDKWKRHRKIILQSFNSKHLVRYVDIVAKHSCKLSDRLQDIADNTRVNLYEYLHECVVFLSFETIMGTEFNRESSQEFLQNWFAASDIFDKRIRKIWLYSENIFNLTTLADQQRKAANCIRNIYSQIIDQKTDEFENVERDEGIPNEKSLSIVEQLIWHSPMRKKDILDETRTLFTASTDTTSRTCGFLLSLLGEHQGEQEKVYKEQMDIFADDVHRLPTAEDLKRMVYLEQVILETLRMYPSLPFLALSVVEDVPLDNGLTIPEGCLFLLNTYCLHRNPEFFPEPERFLPERFSQENVKSRHPYAYLPFGKGRTMCPGNTFAIMAIKTIISTVMRRFKITETVGGMKAIEQSLIISCATLKPKCGFNVRLLPREI